MTLPIKRDIVIHQGATFREILEWYPDGQPMDFTDCTARMQIRRFKDSVEPLIELTTENGGLELGVGDDGAGVAKFISDEDTAVLDLPGWFDLMIDHPNGDVTKLEEGRAILKRSVTRVPAEPAPAP
jgi:hypothetical protein